MYSKILVPLDGSTSAEIVLPYARALAHEFRLPVTLLYVVDIADLATHLSVNNARFMDAMVETELKRARSYLSGIVNTFNDSSVDCAVETGRADEGIIDKADEDKGALIAMATHGRTGLNRWLLGSVAEKVLRATANPLLLVRAGDAAGTVGQVSLESIVVPLDGSPLAESALPHAVEIAKRLKLETVLLRTFDLPASAYYGTEDYYPKYEQLRARTHQEVKNYLEVEVAGLKAKGLEKVSAAVLEGPAAEKIIEFTRNRAGTLVAMCTHGRSGVGRWVLGSVTEKVVRYSGDPVLVISARAEATTSERGVLPRLDEKVSRAMKYTID